MHALQGVPNFCMCLGPGCESGQVHVSGNRQPIMTCNVCGFKTCFTHQMPWHEGMTCADYDWIGARQNEENDASLTLIRNVGMICPSCSAPGIKVSGCDHMTCKSIPYDAYGSFYSQLFSLGPRCLYEYCARCLASYDAIQIEGNTAHKSACPYHSSKIPSNAMTVPDGFLDEDGNLLPWVDEVDGDANVLPTEDLLG